MVHTHLLESYLIGIKYIWISLWNTDWNMSTTKIIFQFLGQLGGIYFSIEWLLASKYEVLDYEKILFKASLWD